MFFVVGSVIPITSGPTPVWKTSEHTARLKKSRLTFYVQHCIKLRPDPFDEGTPSVLKVNLFSEYTSSGFSTGC